MSNGYNTQAIFTFNFNNKLNGRESFLITTRYAKLDDETIDKWHNVELHSYRNSACINLWGVNITPELLRKFADDLEEFEKDIYKE